MAPYVMGLIWDHFTEQVKGQMIRDLIAIKDQPGGSALKVYYEGENHDVLMLISSLQIERSPLAAPATLWVLYQTGNDDLAAPDHARETVVRDMRVGVADARVLDTESQSGFYLAPQGRNITPTLDLNRPMPAHQPGGTDPMIVHLWG